MLMAPAPVWMTGSISGSTNMMSFWRERHAIEKAFWRRTEPHTEAQVYGVVGSEMGPRRTAIVVFRS
jgi:hypothetical protein